MEYTTFPLKRLTVITKLLVMLSMTALSSLPLFATAEAATSFKVGIVDPQEVIEKSRAGKRVLSTLKEHASVRQKLLQRDEDELKALEVELKDGSTLSETEKQSKQTAFRKKLQDYQRRGQEFQQELGQKQKEMVMEYMKKIQTATKAVAEKYGFALVLDKGSDATLRIVLYNKKGLDITKEVVKEFDRRYK
jgi:outer membrane protein